MDDKCSEGVVYILYASRGELVSALEQYQTRYVATHTLPQWCESLNTWQYIQQRTHEWMVAFGYDDE